MEGKDYFIGPAGNILANGDQDVIGLFCSKGTLLFNQDYQGHLLQSFVPAGQPPAHTTAEFFNPDVGFDIFFVEIHEIPDSLCFQFVWSLIYSRRSEETL